MKTREEIGRLQTGRCPMCPAHSPRGNASPLPGPGADPRRRPHATHRPPPRRVPVGTAVRRPPPWSATGEKHRDWSFLCHFKLPGAARRSPWLCMNFSDLMGLPGGRAGGGGGPHALRPLPTEARTLTPHYIPASAGHSDPSPGAQAGTGLSPNTAASGRDPGPDSSLEGPRRTGGSMTSDPLTKGSGTLAH